MDYSVSAYIIPSICLYLLLVRILRTRNLRQLQKQYGHYTHDPYSMDYKTAHKIVLQIAVREFPFTYGFGMQCGIIKSYGIPSTSKLLVQTRRLTSKAKVGKRIEDTSVFLGEMLVSGIDSPRGLLVLSKLNWIHRQYASRISNDELLYTLGLFILEPIRWIDTREWRQLSTIERVAIFIYWKEIGNRMGIHGIPGTLDELKRWNTAFEAGNMGFSETNRMCAAATVDASMRPRPRFMKGFGKRAMAWCMQDYVRPVLGMEEPSRGFSLGMMAFFQLRAFATRHLMLPRLFDPKRGRMDSVTKRIRRTRYFVEPWYVPETVWSTARKTLFGKSTSLPGPEYMSGGYLPEELGPVEYMERSRDAVFKEAEAMKEYVSDGGAAGVGCPFSFSGQNPL
ncbi:hypothetical protein FQN51_006858 [Onygenales sp. PD_10]|nr:hypothetical protein FQN51_006858 [Onygenales sp. PD_10]